MRRKNKLLTKILLMASTIVCCVFVVVAMTYNRNKGPIESSGLVTTYDLTNVIDESKLAFEAIDADSDGTTDSYAFKGMASSTVIGDTENKTLRIPESYNGYPVTTVKALSSSAPDYKNISGITAVIIPDSVTEIETAAFWGYASVEYFETPLVGNIVDPLTGDGLTNDNCFASMFTNPDVEHLKVNFYHLSDSGISNMAEQTTWYNKIPELAQPYYVPNNLQIVKINKETRLCNRAFMKIESLTQITLPDTLIDLGAQYIFTACTNLKTIKLPSTIKNLGNGTFAQCSNLGKVEKDADNNDIPNPIVIPSGITAIPSGMFYQCSELRSVELPAGLKYIESGAFYDCLKLENLKVYNNSGYVSGKVEGFNLPSNLLTIGQSAFKNCSFKEIIIPNSVTEIGKGAFSGNNILEKIVVPFIGSKRGNYGTEDSLFGWIFGTGNETVPLEGSTGSSSVSGGYIAQQYYTYGNNKNVIGSSDTDKSYSYRIPSGLKTIEITDETIVGPGALQELTSVTSISISTTCTTIYEGALRGGGSASSTNTSLTDLIIPAAVTTDGNSVTNNLGSLFGTVAFTNDVPVSQGGITYRIPQSLRSVSLINQETVYSGTFENCTLIESVTIGNNTKRIQGAIFYNNENLSKLVVPFVGTCRGSYNYYHGYYHWEWGPSLYVYDSLMFLFSTEESASEEYYVDYSIWDGFYRRYIPRALETVEVTDDTIIRYSAFREFESLKSVIIHQGQVHTIEEAPFAGCINLENVTLPFVGKDYNTLGKSSRQYVLGWAFGCYGPDYYHGLYINQSDYLYDVWQYSTYRIPKSLKTVNIGIKATNIADYAFAGCKYLQYVDYDISTSEGAHIHSLGNYAFYNCTSLVSLNTVSADYRIVGDYAFYGCSKLTDIPAFTPNTVKEIGDYAFGATSITTIDLSKITKVGEGAFSSCVNLTEVEVPSTVLSLGDYAFQNCRSLQTAKLGEEKVSKYLFKNCINLTTVDLSNVTRMIPEGMFYGCSKIKINNGINPSDKTGVTLHDNTQVIGAYAFAKCYALDQFIIPASVTQFGEYALSETGLALLTIPRTVEKIDAHLCHGNDETFAFWVYDTESNWPSGWVDGWNCEFPVYIVGEQSEDLFTYRYDTELKGYIITGLEDGAVLGDFVKFPTTYHGLVVKGIENDNDSEYYINSQTDLSTVVIPSTYIQIAENVFKVEKDSKLKEIFVYIDKDLESSISSFGETATWGKWLPHGMAYTKESWQYNTKSPTDIYPYLKLDQFTVNLVTFEGFELEYDGTSKYMFIDSIEGPGYEFGYTKDSNGNSQNIMKFISSDDFETMSIFNVSYKDNIVVSKQAKHILTANNAELNLLNNTRNDNDLAIIRLIGEKITHFTINKKKIFIYPTSDDNVYSKEFDNAHWRNSTWGNSNVQGLEDMGFTLTGTLETDSYYAGTYKAVYDFETGAYVNGENGFRWASDYRIYDTNGRNVADNFEIVIAKLEVTIQRRDIAVIWTGGKWCDCAACDNEIYTYGYRGQAITPTAYFAAFDTNNQPTIKITDVEPVIYNNGTDWNMYINHGSGTPYAMYAKLTNNRNYHLVNYDRSTIVGADGRNFDSSISEEWTLESEIQFIKQEYYITKGTVMIEIIDDNWLIGINDYYWEMDTDDWAKYCSSNYSKVGLGPNSKIQGTLSADDGELNVQYIYSNIPSATVESTMEWDKNPKKNNLKTFNIWNDSLSIDETDCYDVTFNVRITVKYHTFDVEYFVTNEDKTVLEVQDYVTIPDPNSVEGLPMHKITYTTKGGGHYFGARAINAILADDSEYKITYQYGSNIQTAVWYSFSNIGEHRVGVKIERRNFHTYQWTVEIDCIRSNVLISEILDKEYDKHPYDITEYVLDKADDQEIIAVYYDASDPNNLVKLDEAPTEIGIYAVDLTVQYPDYPYTGSEILPDNYYYNNYHGLLYFNITPRKIYIDVNGWKFHDGKVVSFGLEDPDSGVLGIPNLDSYLLEGDTFSGILSSVDSVNGYYTNNYRALSDGSIVYTDWVWTQPFAVFNIDGTTSTSNYQIVIVGTYEIRLNIFDVTLTNVDVVFDNNTHSIGFELHNTNLPDDLDVTFIYAGTTSHTNFSFVNTNNETPYIVYVKITGAFFETYYQYATVLIRNAEIKFKINGDPDDLEYVGSQEEALILPAEFYTENFYRIYAEPISPFNATVYYTTATATNTIVQPQFKEPGRYTIHYRLEATNYNPAEGTIIFEITDENLKTMSDTDVIVTNWSGQYDPINETERSITVEISPTFVYDKYCDIYYSLTGDEDSYFKGEENNPKFSQAGVYTVYVKVKTYGYHSYYTTGQVIIEPIDLLGISTFGPTLYYDGEYHGIIIKGLGLNSDIDPSDVPNPSLPSLDKITVSYTTNIDVYNNQLEEGWTTEEIKYKDAGVYDIYVKVEAPNYKTLYFAETLTIQTVQFYATVELEENRIQYSNVGLNVDDIFVSETDSSGNVKLKDGEPIATKHDGSKIIYFYYAYVDEDNGIFTEDTTQAFDAPTELGYYYVHIIYFATGNCYQMEATGFIQIVPRVLEVHWTESYEYDGHIHSPNAYVTNLVGSDKVHLYQIPVGFVPNDAYQIGTYQYKLELYNNAVSANYVLDRDTITMEITKRKIHIKIEYLNVEYQGDMTPYQYESDDFIRDMIALDEKYDKDIQNIFLEGSLLSNGLDIHTLQLGFHTLVGIKGEYIYDKSGNLFQNMILLDKCQIVDQNGDNVTGKYYDFDIEIIIDIDYRDLEIDLEPYTVKYDGDPHYIYEDVEGGIRSLVTSPGASITAVYYSEDIDADQWLANPITKVNVGEYQIAFYILSSTNKPYKGYATFIIEPTELEIEVIEDTYDNDCYDAKEHNVSYNILNVNNFMDTPYIKYYKTSEYNKDDLYKFYMENFGENKETYKEGLDSYVDAGEYYAIVYFPQPSSNNYKEICEIFTFYYDPKPIDITLTNTSETNYSTHVTTYFGHKYIVPLGSYAIIDENDLLDGHHINPSLIPESTVQTISPNAGEYFGEDGFEFKDMLIYNDLDENVAYNYKPIVRYLKVTIEKAEIIPGVNFMAEDLVKEFDGKPNYPTVITDSDGHLSYQFYSVAEDGSLTALATYPINVGKYLVYCYIDEGTNFLKYDGDEVYAYVECKPRRVAINWENLEQEFCNQYLAPTATFEDVSGNIQNMIVTIMDMDENGNIVGYPSRLLAGQYLALASPMASFDSKNYDFEYSESNYSKIFEITPIEYILDVDDIWYSDESEWSKEVSIDEPYRVLKDDVVVGLSDLASNGYGIQFQLGLGFFDNTGKLPAKLYTISSMPGHYNGTEAFEWDAELYSYKLLSNGSADPDSIVDITNSIKFIINGAVTINSYKLDFITTDLEVSYNGANHSVWDGITLINPTTNKDLIIKYKYTDEDGNVEYLTKAPEIINVGEYFVEFVISGPGLDPVESSITITVVQAKSFITFLSPLDKEYDGVAVDKSSLTFIGAWNDVSSSEDLIFTFYDESGAELTSAPVDVGTYQLIVTCAKDYTYDVDGNITGLNMGNYSTLSAVLQFSITPRVINLELTYDKLIESNADLGITDDRGYEEIQNHKDLYNHDILKYRFVAQGIKHGEVKVKIKLTEENANILPVGDYIYYTYGIYDDSDNYIMSFTTFVYNKGRYNTNGSGVNVYESLLSNYSVSLNLTYDVHFEEMDIDVDNINIKYDGFDHSAIIDDKITINNPLNQSYISGTKFTDLTFLFSETGASDSFKEEDIVQKTPVIGRTIYYKVVQTSVLNGSIGNDEKQYEPFYGQFTITVEYLTRTISDIEYFYDLAGNVVNSKIYDTLPAGVEVTRTIDGETEIVYIPNKLTITREQMNGATLADYSDDDIKNIYMKVVYRQSNGSVSNKAVDTGNYYYTITIPASTYYAETKYTSRTPISITRATIYIADKDSDGDGDTEGYIHVFDNSNPTYTAFQATDCPYDIYSLDSAGNKLTVSGLKIYGTLTANSSQVGVYHGSATSGNRQTLYWKNSNYSVEVDGVLATKNYSLNISKASITVVTADMDYEIVDHVVEYNGKNFYPTVVDNINGTASLGVDGTVLSSVVIKKPFVLNKVKYSYTGEEGTYVDTPLGEKTVGQHILYLMMIADNYNTTCVEVVYNVSKALTKFNVPDLSRTYDGKEVLFPVLDTDGDGVIDATFTNNTEVVYADYFIYYDRKVGNNWVTMSDERPVDVGVYKINIQIPDSTSFIGGEFSREFTIKGYESDVSWNIGNYVYNGKAQSPNAYVATMEGDVLNLVYKYQEVTNSGLIDLGTNVPVEVGQYIVTVSIDDNTNYIIPEDKGSCTYLITPRKVIIQLRGGYYYNAAGLEFIYDDGTTGLFKYNALNIVEGHTTETSKIITKKPNVGIYNNFDNFEWRNLSDESISGPVFLDENGSDVTKNYLYDYDISLLVTYSDLQYSIEGFDGPYDGLEHSITVTVNTVNQETDELDYIVKYSLENTTDLSKYRTENYAFTEVGSYVVYVYIEAKVLDESTGEFISQSEFKSGAVNITEIDSNLQLKNPFENLNKVYDGKPVVNPEMTYTNSDTLTRNVIYKYYKLSTDEATGLEVETPMLKNPVEVGKYRVYISLEGSGNYADDDVRLDFDISKRNLVISLPNPVYKKYDIDDLGWKWEVPTNYVMPNATENEGLVEGQIFKGILQTALQDVNVYDEEHEFQWITDPEIYIDGTPTQTQHNYNILYDLEVHITPGDIEFTANSTRYVYSGIPRSIFIEVTKPYVYTIYYSTDGINFSTTKPTRVEVGVTPIYFYIEAPNYARATLTTYSVTITSLARPEDEENDNRLEELEVFLNDVETPLTPGFTPDNEGVYKIEALTPATNEVLFKYTPKSPSAVVQGFLGDTQIDLSVPYPLDFTLYDEYLFKLIVTAPNEDIKIYQVLLTTEVVTLDDDNEITNIQIADSNDSTKTNIFTDFDPDYYGPYTIIVPDDVEFVDVFVTMSSPNAYVSINNSTVDYKKISLVKEQFVEVEVICTAENCTKGTPYIIYIGYDDSVPPGTDDDNRLFMLEILVDGVLQNYSPTFDPDTSGVYIVENVDSSSNIVTFNAMPMNMGATVTYTSVDCTQVAGAENEFNLDFSTSMTNKFEITVSTDTSAIKTYTVWISSSAVDLSDENGILDISVFEGADDAHATNLLTTFDPLNHDLYTIIVNDSETEADVVVKVKDKDSTVSFNGNSGVKLSDDTYSYTVTLTEGIMTLVEVVCTSASGEEGESYILNIGDSDDLGPILPSGDIVYIAEYTFDGNPYMGSFNPYHQGYTLDDQEIYYYAIDDTTCSTPITKPTYVGAYQFVIKLKATAAYDEKYLDPITFNIIRREVEVSWTNLEFVYDNNPHKPKATFTDVNGTVVNLIVSSERIPVGIHQAIASINSSSVDANGKKYIDNYTLTNYEEEFEITPKEVSEPLIKEDIIIEYGDDLVVVTIDGTKYSMDDQGNIVEILYSDGTPYVPAPGSWPYRIFVDADVNANGVSNSLTNANGKHTITVELVDKDNTIWEVSQTNDDLIFEYDIIPQTINPDTHELVVTLIDDYYQIHTGSAIEPKVKVELKNKEDGTSIELSDDSLNEIEITYENNINIGEAKIIVTSLGHTSKHQTTTDAEGNTYTVYLGNYNFQVETKFEIVEKKPDVITLKSDATIGFIEITTNASGEATFGFDPITEKQTKQQNIYLGQLYQNTSITGILNQIANSSYNIKVYDANGNVISPKLYGNYYFGTGYRIELYEEAVYDADGNDISTASSKLIDSIDAVLFGDVTCDGMIDNMDIAIFANMLKDLDSYRANMDTTWFSAYVIQNAATVPDVNMLMRIANYFKNTTDPNYDFNINYKPIV